MATEKVWCNDECKKDVCNDCNERVNSGKRVFTDHPECQDVQRKHYSFPEKKKMCAGGCGKLMCIDCWDAHHVQHAEDAKTYHCRTCLNYFCVDCLEDERDEDEEPICSNFECRLLNDQVSKKDKRRLRDLCATYVDDERSSNKKRKRGHRK